MVNIKVDGYAGDISPLEAWDLLKTDAKALLIDVRTAAEWSYVGIADLSSISKEIVLIEWQSFPQMLVNQNFVSQVREVCANNETTIISLCRSGQRSISTSRTLTAAGYKNCLNLLEGFEGDINYKNQRGQIGGWKFSGLPWKQA